MKTVLFLTRHGETEWNVEGKMQGLKDSPLTKLGKRQAKWLKSSLKDIKFDAIYSSPSPRTYQTAEIIREERENEIIICDNLKEISLGSWEGHKKSDIENLFPDEYHSFWYTAHLYKPSNDGESFSQLQDRIIPTVLDIINRHKGGNVLIVTHAIALKVIMAYFRGDSLEKLWNPPTIQPTSLNKVVITDTEYNIELYGDTSHFQTVRKAVGAIVFQGDNFLLVHKLLNTFDKESGVWDFPKGGVEEEDLSLKDAIMRELLEETGTDKYIIKQELPEKITFYFDDDIKKKIGFECQETTMFLVEFVGNQIDLKPCGEEIDEILLIDSENLLDKLSHKETVAFIQNHCQFLLTGRRGLTLSRPLLPMLRAEGIIVRKDGLAFLVQCDSEESFYRFPGGGVEFGETAAEAIKRELIEEFDLQSDIGELACLNESIVEYDGRKRHDCTILHWGSIDDTHVLDSINHNEREGIKLTWRTFEQLKQRPLFPEGILVFLIERRESVSHIVIRKNYDEE